MDRWFRIIAPNRIVKLDDGTAVIRVTRLNGDVIEFLIDSRDIRKVSCRRWFWHTGYCCTTKYGRQWPLQWELMGKPERGYILHHVNENRGDNRRSNLRLVTWAANNLFKKPKANRSTGIRGVSVYADGSIVALIGPGGKRKCFRSLEEAVAARKQFEKTMEEQITPPAKGHRKVLRRSKSKVPK